MSCPGKFIREDNTRCDFCGSLEPNLLMKLLEEGKALLGPTDKNYKVYVDIPEEHPEVIRIVAHAGNIKQYPECPSGGEWKVWDRGDGLVDGMSMKDGDWFQEAPRGPIRYAKFYFEHLSSDQQTRFVELYNQKKLNIDYPGYFYRWPFFMCPAK